MKYALDAQEFSFETNVANVKTNVKMSSNDSWNLTWSWHNNIRTIEEMFLHNADTYGKFMKFTKL